MDKILAHRLASDEAFRQKLSSDALNYVQLGQQTLDYNVGDFDAAHDAYMCHAPLTVSDFDKLERGHPKRFILPMTATQITTLTCFISQILFGTNANRRVEPREDTDEEASDSMNQLLRWNDDQQPSYLQGYLFIQDCLTFNRGITYDHWCPIQKVETVEVEEEDTTVAEVKQKIGEDGEPLFDKDGKPVPDYPTYTRYKKKRSEVGGYNRIDLVSPYDWICDPALPLHRFQEGRFAGHRVMIPWHELKRRSNLDPSHPDYVLPEAVNKLKSAQADKSAVLPSATGGGDGVRSRSAYERSRRGGIGGSDSKTANKDDGGIVECWLLQVRIVPSQHDIFPEDDDYEIAQFLIGGQELLSINIMPNKHDQFTYSAAEARPYPHYQFSPSWAMLIKPIQDHADYLKDKHQEALARTAGMMFIGNPRYFDFKALTDPNKIGLVIPTTEECPDGVPLNQIISQVPVQDLTKDFYNEMQQFIGIAENTTGAHAYVQGEGMETGSDTATEFVGIQQMASGRISSTARLIWSQAVGPQTNRFVSNFQQFLPDEMVVRVAGESWRPDDPNKGKYLRISRESIQGNFDLVIHDGALPGADAKKVAAASRLIEVLTSNETLMSFCDPSVPGNIDLKSLALETWKATGVPMGNFLVSDEQAQRNQQQAIQSKYASMGVSMAPQQPQQPAPPQQQGAPQGLSLPSAEPQGLAGVPPQASAIPALQ